MRGLVQHPLGIRSVHNRKWICGFVAAVVVSAPAFAASYANPVIVTLDARDYITYTTAAITPATRVLSVPDTGIVNCRRADGSAIGSGKWKLHRSAHSLDVDFETVRVEFNPTRLVLDSSTHDIVCDGQALGWQTGIGRVFRDDFDA